LDLTTIETAKAVAITTNSRAEKKAFPEIISGFKADPLNIHKFHLPAIPLTSLHTVFLPVLSLQACAKGPYPHFTKLQGSLKVWK
jgi:hypothetical protein